MLFLLKKFEKTLWFSNIWAITFLFSVYSEALMRSLVESKALASLSETFTESYYNSSTEWVFKTSTYLSEFYSKMLSGDDLSKSREVNTIVLLIPVTLDWSWVKTARSYIRLKLFDFSLLKKVRRRFRDF